MLGAHLDSIIESFYDAILLGLCLLRYLSLKQEKVIYVVLNFACWSMHRPSGFKSLRFGSISRVVLLLFLRIYEINGGSKIASTGRYRPQEGLQGTPEHEFGILLCATFAFKIPPSGVHSFASLC